MAISVEKLIAPRIDSLSEFQKKYENWRVDALLVSERPPKLSSRILDEVRELDEAWMKYGNSRRPRDLRLAASEAGDVFNFALSLLTVEGRELDSVLSNGHSITTFKDLQKEASNFVEPTIERGIEVLYELQDDLKNAVTDDNKTEIVELSSKLIVKSTAMVNQMGFDIYPVIAAKLHRNQIAKYPPEKMRHLVENEEKTIDEAQMICQRDWEPYKNFLDELFLLAQLEDSSRLERALSHLKLDDNKGLAMLGLMS